MKRLLSFLSRSVLLLAVSIASIVLSSCTSCGGGGGCGLPPVSCFRRLADGSCGASATVVSGCDACPGGTLPEHACLLPAFDAGESDAGSPDASMSADAGEGDASGPDAGDALDGGELDAGAPDGGEDGGEVDGGDA
ncbi:MAG: hypothetical protein AB7S26_05200 [Sandaracinaceae bacterium]